MGNEFVYSIFLLLLLLIVHVPGNASGQMKKDADVLRLPSMDVTENHDVKHGHGGHSSSHMRMHMGMAEMSSSITVFFLIKDVKVGNVIPIYFPQIDPSKSFHFLPRQQADSIPFSSKALPFLLRRYSFSPDSLQAKAMIDTLSTCEKKSVDITYCATSLESLTDFARSLFGSEYSGIEILRTPLAEKSTPTFQNYTVLDWEEIPAPMVLPCHNKPYPYTVYYCHTQKTETKVFKVSLEGENGSRLDAVSVCHLDTSDWDPDHIAFSRLGVKPGTSEVCHFFPSDDLVIVPVLPTS